MATLTLRLGDEIHVRLRHAADEDRRSINGEIEWMIESMLDFRATAQRPHSADEVPVPVSVLTELIGAPGTENAQKLAMDDVQRLLTAHRQEQQR